MLPIEYVLAGAMLVAVTFYAVLAGADFGGGVWDLLASGPRAKAQRDLISHAIAPIWEANHVWLILVLVLLFNAFPPAFYAIMVALHIPLTLSLIGIVLRGAAFTFRHYDAHTDDVQRRWGRIFAIASTITPLTLGMCVGAIASGKIQTDLKQMDFFAAWLAPFPITIGLLALSVFAFIAAVFLTVEADDPAVRDDFRARALAAAALVFVFAWAAFALSGEGAPRVRYGLLHSKWSMAFHALTGSFALAAIAALWLRKFLLARVAAALQVVFIIWGWGLAQFPYLVEPALTIEAAAAPKATLWILFAALAAGTLLLVPSFYLLYRLFKDKSYSAKKT